LGGLDGWLDRLHSRRWKDAPTAYLLLLPALIVLGTFAVAPLFSGMYLSLYKTDGITGTFVGLENYTHALTGKVFWQSVLVMVYYALFTIPVSLVLSFVVANFLHRVARARGLFRTVYFLPYVTSAVAAAMVWRFIFRQEESGLGNLVLGWFGIEPQKWLLESRGVLHLCANGIAAALSDVFETSLPGVAHALDSCATDLVPPTVGPSLALCCVIVFEIWHSTGFMIVVFLAGLSAIPRELEEAARIDGAGWFQVTRRVTLPLLSPTVFFLAIVGVIKAFQAFNSFYVLMGDSTGRVRETTQNLTLYVYRSLKDGDCGYGAAVATLLCAAIVFVTLVQWRAVGRRVHYE